MAGKLLLGPFKYQLSISFDKPTSEWTTEDHNFALSLYPGYLNSLLPYRDWILKV